MSMLLGITTSLVKNIKNNKKDLESEIYFRIFVSTNNIYKYKTQIMSKFFEVTVEVVVAQLKNGKDKKNKEIYLVDAMSVTEAESRVIKDFEESGIQLDYKVASAKESRVLRVIE